MKQKIFLLLFLSSLIFNKINAQQKFSTAGFFAVENAPRTVQSFNPGWRFLKGKIENGQAVNLDDSNWEAANLPHGLEVLGENASGGRNYQGVAWYRKKFNLTPAKNGKVFLYFEAIMGHAEIWINGVKVIEHFGGYLPFTADITEYLKSDGNLVAVKADNSDNKLYLPGKPQSRLDFTYMGGIYRDCFLIQTSDVHVTLRELSDEVAGGGIFAATLDINGQSAKMEVRTEVQNSSDKKQNLTVRTTIENADKKTIKTMEQTIQLKPNESQQLAKQFELQDAHFWHPDNPYLHFIKTEVIDKNGKIVDALRTRIGIRLFEMRGAEGLFVNKKYIGKKVIGVNRHQDYTYIGNALPNSAHWRDVKILRSGGSHIIRAGHYPQDPAFYDACDEFGMLTTTANPGWHFFNFKAPIFEKRLYEDTRQLVRRDRNIASMLLWETALNETPTQPKTALNTMHKIAHEEYPFPGMFTVTDYQEASKAGLDIHYHGNDPNINSFNREFGDGGEVDDWYAQNARTRVKMEWGEQALINQAMWEAEYLDARFATEKVRFGAAMWCGIDHQRGYHPDPFWGGQLNGLRLPRYTYFLYKSQNSPTYKLPNIETGPMVYIANELTQISPTDVVVFSNCEEVRLLWDKKIIATQKLSRDSFKHLPHPPFIFKNLFEFTSIKHRGKGKKTAHELTAEGLIKGKVVTTMTKNYARRTEKLKLEIDNEGMDLVANGGDFIPIRAILSDGSGHRKILADENVYFEVLGEGEIIGGIFNQGNPAKATLGIATALLKSTTIAGKIEIRAYAKGLQSDTITLHSVPSKLPLLYDKNYRAESKTTDKAIIKINQKIETNDLPTEVKTLQEELKKLQLEMIGKDQDIMDLRSKLKGKNE